MDRIVLHGRSQWKKYHSLKTIKKLYEEGKYELKLLNLI